MSALADGGKREGMVERPNNPEEKVRGLQRQLWTCAKRSRSRRFHALHDRIWRGDVLLEAWRRVKANGGAAGVDEESISDIEGSGAAEWLRGIQTVLKAGRYGPTPVRRRYIPKGDGRQRPLGMPTVRDRVVQMATRLVIEPILEADFQPSSWGCRPRRGATQAMEVIREAGNRGHNWALDADIRDYFGSIDHEKLTVPVRDTLARTPRGGVISPLLSNIYLDFLDRIGEDRCKHLGILVRYADDFVILCKNESQRKGTSRRAKIVMERLGLELHPEKTRMANLARNKEGFTFLGSTVRKRGGIQRNSRWYFVQRRPSPKAMKRIRSAVHELSEVRGRPTRNLEELIERLNPVLWGWSNYFHTGNAKREFNRLDSYVYERMTRWCWRRGGQRTRYRFGRWPRERLYEMGLHRLRGTVRYPQAATPRVHSLKGGAGNGSR